jgi:hypothetical protein
MEAKSFVKFGLKFLFWLLVVNLFLDALDTFIPGGISGWVYSPLRKLGIGAKPAAA